MKNYVSKLGDDENKPAELDKTDNDKNSEKIEKVTMNARYVEMKKKEKILLNKMIDNFNKELNIFVKNINIRIIQNCFLLKKDQIVDSEISISQELSTATNSNNNASGTVSTAINADNN